MNYKMNNGNQKWNVQKNHRFFFCKMQNQILVCVRWSKFWVHGSMKLGRKFKGELLRRYIGVVCCLDIK